jgi:hypothetical protein
MEDCGGWYAVITTKNTPPHAVYGFFSEIEAWRWLLRNKA